MPVKGLSEYFMIFSRYSYLMAGLLISSLRFFDSSRKGSSWSNPKNRRFNKLAAIPVVLLPVNGSRIQSFSFVDASMILASKGSGSEFSGRSVHRCVCGSAGFQSICCGCG